MWTDTATDLIYTWDQGHYWGPAAGVPCLELYFSRANVSRTEHVREDLLGHRGKTLKLLLKKGHKL